MMELVDRLDALDAEWRQDSIILLDGAGYHCSDDTKRTIKDMNLPVIWSGAYAYDAAAVEMAIGFIKSVDLNKEALPTGKQVSKVNSLLC
jgi:hypothetical protein